MSFPLRLFSLKTGSKMNRTELKLPMIFIGALLGVHGPAWSKDWDKGQIEYKSKCAVCHGVDGKGGGPLAAQLKTAPADLTQLAKRSGGVFPQGAVIETIDGRKDVEAHGPRDMPVWGYRPMRGDEPGRKTREQALVDYLGRIQEK